MRSVAAGKIRYLEAIHALSEVKKNAVFEFYKKQEFSAKFRERFVTEIARINRAYGVKVDFEKGLFDKNGYDPIVERANAEIARLTSRAAQAGVVVPPPERLKEGVAVATAGRLKKATEAAARNSNPEAALIVAGTASDLGAMPVTADMIDAVSADRLELTLRISSSARVSLYLERGSEVVMMSTPDTERAVRLPPAQAKALMQNPALQKILESQRFNLFKWGEETFGHLHIHECKMEYGKVVLKDVSIDGYSPPVSVDLSLYNGHVTMILNDKAAGRTFFRTLLPGEIKNLEEKLRVSYPEVDAEFTAHLRDIFTKGALAR